MLLATRKGGLDSCAPPMPCRADPANNLKPCTITVNVSRAAGQRLCTTPPCEMSSACQLTRIASHAAGLQGKPVAIQRCKTYTPLGAPSGVCFDTITNKRGGVLLLASPNGGVLLQAARDVQSTCTAGQSLEAL